MLLLSRGLHELGTAGGRPLTACRHRVCNTDGCSWIRWMPLFHLLLMEFVENLCKTGHGFRFVCGFDWVRLCSIFVSRACLVIIARMYMVFGDLIPFIRLKLNNMRTLMCKMRWPPNLISLSRPNQGGWWMIVRFLRAWCYYWLESYAQHCKNLCCFWKTIYDFFHCKRRCN